MIRKIAKSVIVLSLLVSVLSFPTLASARTLKQGMEGSDVKDLQVQLKVNPSTGYFGTLTKSAVITFQKNNKLDADGIVGPQTSSALTKTPTSSNPSTPPATPPTSTVLKQGMENQSVKDLQTKLITMGYLKATATGYFGTATKQAVIDFQKAKGLTADGIAGPATFAALGKTVVSKPYTIAIDAGHGGKDVGAVAYDGTYESAITLQYSEALKSELLSRGYKVVTTRTTDTACNSSTTSTSVELQCRINKAQSQGANVFVSVHMNASTAPSARGTETYYYGNGGGKTLATKIHNTTKSSIGSLNRGVLEKNLYVLRYTNIPATLVEVGFITNASDLSSIKSSSVRSKYVSNLVDGIDDYYGY